MKPEYLALLPADKRLIVSAGAPRSGSTALFNILRLLLEQEGGALTTGWIHDLADPLEATVLVKVHRWEPALAKRANIALTCHRDLREVARSLARVGRLRNGLEIFDQFGEIVYRHLQWKANAAIDVSYENITNNLSATVMAIARLLGINKNLVDSDAIAKQIYEITPPVTLPESQPHDLKTLLHKNHRSRHPTPPIDIEKDIHHRFAAWQTLHGYD